MPLIDRTALVLVPKAPYLTWVKTLPGADLSLTLEQLRATPVVFLLPVAERPEEVLTWLQGGCELLFIHMLAAFTQEEIRLPQDRSFAVFREWFDFSLAPMVNDLQPFFEAAATANEDGTPTPPAKPSGIQIVSR
jgi:hypothetical protein